MLDLLLLLDSCLALLGCWAVLLSASVVLVYLDMASLLRGWLARAGAVRFFDLEELVRKAMDEGESLINRKGYSPPSWLSWKREYDNRSYLYDSSQRP